MKVKKVFKYGTGQPIPEGAVYLHTLVEETKSFIGEEKILIGGRFVWHYFLVEVEE